MNHSSLVIMLVALSFIALTCAGQAPGVAPTPAPKVDIGAAAVVSAALLTSIPALPSDFQTNVQARP